MMSGGAYDYLYCGIEDMYTGEMEDKVMEQILQDFCEILRSLEWFRSGDTGIEDYMKDVTEFKKKWLKDNYMEDK